MIRPPPRSPLFPYTTLFRSRLRPPAVSGARPRLHPLSVRAPRARGGAPRAALLDHQRPRLGGHVCGADLDRAGLGVGDLYAAAVLPHHPPRLGGCRAARRGGRMDRFLARGAAALEAGARRACRGGVRGPMEEFLLAAHPDALGRDERDGSRDRELSWIVLRECAVPDGGGSNGSRPADRSVLR